MGSIFDVSYDSNLERLSAPSQAPSPKLSSEKPDSRNFSSVLADLERQDNKTNGKNVKENSGLVATPPPSTIDKHEELSNIDFHERSFIESSKSAAQSESIGPSEISKDSKTPGKGVKKPDLSVNITSPEKADPLLASKNTKSPVNFSELVKTARSKAEMWRVSYSKAELHDIISTAGIFHGVDPNLSLAVAEVESSLIVDAVSKDGHFSKGIFQLLDSTAGDMMEHTKIEQDQYEPFDPAMNAFLGVGYLRFLLDTFSSETKLTRNISTVAASSAANLEKLAIAAYNAGQGRVAQAQARAEEAGLDPSDFSKVAAYLPSSTRAYVEKVDSHKQALAQLNNNNKAV